MSRKNARSTERTLLAVARLLVVLVVCRTTFLVVLGYRDYFPPDFRSDFLLGRDGYFFGAYQWAFYTHIAVGPVTLLVGMLLLSEHFRRRRPAWHRRLGRVQVACVLLLLAPSGLWMARYAATGAVAAAGFGALSVATAIAFTMGWRTAVARDFARHRRWMLRGFVLLASAVTLRAMGGVAQLLEINGVYPFAAWASWLAPLLVLEWASFTALRSPRRRLSSAWRVHPWGRDR